MPRHAASCRSFGNRLATPGASSASIHRRFRSPGSTGGLVGATYAAASQRTEHVSFKPVRCAPPPRPDPGAASVRHAGGQSRRPCGGASSVRRRTPRRRANGSSIAVLVEYGRRRCLLAADAFAPVLADGLGRLASERHMATIIASLRAPGGSS